jgi:RimJ/RimL family protein N-acetyltransferase
MKTFPMKYKICYIHTVTKKMPLEIIYAFKQSYWGKRFASEFVQTMIETGFERW